MGDCAARTVAFMLRTEPVPVSALRVSIDYRRRMTMARKYSVEEIDRMRRAIYWMIPKGSPLSDHQWSLEVESRLRTHMQNGTEPVGLERMAARSGFDAGEAQAMER